MHDFSAGYGHRLSLCSSYNTTELSDKWLESRELERSMSTIGRQHLIPRVQHLIPRVQSSVQRPNTGPLSV